MYNEQVKRLYPIVCLVAVFMSFMFFYTCYRTEHEAMLRLQADYEKVLVIYKTRLEDCRND